MAFCLRQCVGGEGKGSPEMRVVCLADKPRIIIFSSITSILFSQAEAVVRMPNEMRVVTWREGARPFSCQWVRQPLVRMRVPSFVDGAKIWQLCHCQSPLFFRHYYGERTVQTSETELLNEIEEEEEEEV